MGRRRAPVTTAVGTLIHEYLGPRTYRSLRLQIKAQFGVERSEEAIRNACRGEAGPEAYRGLQAPGGGTPLSELVRRALYIPEDKFWDALAEDWKKTARARVSARKGYSRHSLSHQRKRAVLFPLARSRGP